MVLLTFLQDPENRDWQELGTDPDTPPGLYLGLQVPEIMAHEALNVSDAGPVIFADPRRTLLSLIRYFPFVNDREHTDIMVTGCPNTEVTSPSYVRLGGGKYLTTGTLKVGGTQLFTRPVTSRPGQGTARKYISDFTSTVLNGFMDHLQRNMFSSMLLLTT
jgi:hypothetical protein